MRPLKDIRSRDNEMQLTKSDSTLYTRARNVAPVSKQVKVRTLLI